MKLQIGKRADVRKSEINALRRSGKIPAILYSSKRPAQKIAIDAAAFNAFLREMEDGKLPTTVFTLEGEGSTHRALIKDIQYQPTSYRINHIDFEELIEGMPVTTKIPILCVGEAECTGVKLGGFLRQVIRYVKVECLPKDIPSQFVLDVKNLGIKQSMRLSDIAMPKGVKPLAKLQEVVVTVTRRTT